MNTRDLLGDDETFRTIISGGTINEFEENDITTLYNNGLLHGSCRINVLNFPNVTALFNSDPTYQSSFFYCTAKEIYFPNLKTANGGNMSFNNCSNLEKVDFPELTTLSGTAHINFTDCAKLEEINFPKLTTGTLFYYDNFKNMPKLRKILIPKVTSLRKQAFYASSSNYGTYHVTEVDISSATSIEQQAFQSCRAINSIKCSNVKTLGNGVFSGCSSLTNLTFNQLTSIGASCFSGCNSLASIIIRTPSVCSLANTNAFTSAAKQIYVPDELVDSYKEATNWSTYASWIHPISELPEEEETT